MARKRQRQAAAENAIHKAGGSLLSVMSLFSAIATAICLMTFFSDEQFTITEMVFCGMLFVGFFLGLRHLYRLGYDVIPHMEGRRREVFMPIYGVVLAVGVLIAALTSALGVTGDPVRQHHIQQIGIKTGSYAAQTVGTANLVFSQTSLIEGKNREIVSAERGEVANGSHCGSGRGGNGTCATLLRSLALTTNSSLSDLRRAESAAAPLITRIETETEALRRVAGERDISYSEKRSRILTHIAQIDLMSRQLQQLVPISLLESLSADWTRDYSTGGMSAQGQDRLNTMLSDPSRDLTTTAQAARHQFSLDAPELSSPNLFALVARYADDMALLLVIAVFPDILAVAIILFNFIVSNKPNEDDEFFFGDGLEQSDPPSAGDVRSPEQSEQARPPLATIQGGPPI